MVVAFGSGRKVVVVRLLSSFIYLSVYLRISVITFSSSNVDSVSKSSINDSSNFGISFIVIINLYNIRSYLEFIIGKIKRRSS